MPTEDNTTASKAELEFDAWLALLRRRPFLPLGILMVILSSIGFNIYNYFYGIPALQRKNSSLEGELHATKTDQQLCETKLAPFKAIAIEMYSGPENEALVKLSLRVQEIDKQLRADRYFHEAAKIDLDGGQRVGGVNLGSSVNGWARDCADIKEDKIEYLCNDKCIKQYFDYSNRNWWWPYSLFGIAVCLKEAKNDNYLYYADLGMTLLDQFSLVPFHRREHEKYLEYFDKKFPGATIRNVKFRD